MINLTVWIKADILGLFMVKVLICDRIKLEAFNTLKEVGVEVDYRPGISQTELTELIKDYEVLVVRGRTKITREVVMNGEKLSLIVRVGVGLDNIDLKAAAERGVEVINTPEALTNAVAELALGLMIALARMICYGDSELKQGRWVKDEIMGVELEGKVLGIVGFGRIGQELAKKALALGMKVIGFRRRGISKEFKDMGVVEAKSLEEVFEKSDFVSIHLPLTEETRHLIGWNLIKRMKKSSYLINTSRGAVVDTSALKKALMSGLIAGAALDVFEVEPPDRDELIMMRNVVVTPHIGGQTVEAQEKAARLAVEKILSYLKMKNLYKG